MKAVVRDQNGRKTQETAFWHFFKLTQEHDPFLQDLQLKEIDCMPFRTSDIILQCHNLTQMFVITCLLVGTRVGFK